MPLIKFFAKIRLFIQLHIMWIEKIHIIRLFIIITTSFRTLFTNFVQNLCIKEYLFGSL